MVYVALAYEFAVGGIDGRERTVFILALYAGDLVGVYPAVPGNYALFFVLFDYLWGKIF